MKKKSFYFEDYHESEIEYENKKFNAKKISLDRVNFLYFIFITLIVIFSIKIIYLSLSKEKISYKNISQFTIAQERRDIVDRNGEMLSTNVELYDIGVRPKLLNIKEKKNLLIKLALTFPALDLKKIKLRLNGDDFFWLGKRLTPDEKTQFWLIGNKAFVFERKTSRIYPQKNLFSHVLGQTDDLNNGISGIEKSLDKNLKDKTKNKVPLRLTLDSNLQYLVREELIEAQSHFNNIGSAAILMEVESGEILSLVSLPDYDLNKRNLINNEIYLNKITLGVYELGSVFKTFTIAAGLENKVIKSNTVFKNLEPSLMCGSHKISEHDPLPKNLSVEQILVRSSNIGAVKIAQKVGLIKFKEFLNSLDLFQKIKFDLDEVGVPLEFKWGKCKLATASFGRGIATTPLQLARAYAIIGNGGYTIEPFILKKKILEFKKGRQIISTETSNSINSMLRKVVNLEEGTANFANIEGYEVAGKTGTSVKYNNQEKRNTFVTLFPSHEPKHVLLVMLDEPKPAPNFVYNMPSSEKYPNGYKHKGETRNTSGWNTVVVAGKIIEKIGPILATKNLEASKNF